MAKGGHRIYYSAYIPRFQVWALIGAITLFFLVHVGLKIWALIGHMVYNEYMGGFQIKGPY